jgi:isocitrate lyase
MKLSTLALGLVFVSGLAIAADSENSAKETTDVSKNPITGSVTTTKKASRTVKTASGKRTMDVKKTTKVKKDGTVEESVKVDGDSTAK